MKKQDVVKKAKKESGGNNLIDRLNGDPSERNWELFRKQIKKDRAKYYSVIYPTEVKDRMNLKKAYAVIYDNKYRQLYRVPIIKSTKRGIEGATINLEGLEVNRRVMK
jgi:hypothetical protein